MVATHTVKRADFRYRHHFLPHPFVGARTFCPTWITATLATTTLALASSSSSTAQLRCLNTQLRQRTSV